MEVYVIYYKNQDNPEKQGYVGGDRPIWCQQDPKKFYDLKQARRIVKTYLNWKNKNEMGIFQKDNETWEIRKLGVVETGFCI